MTRSYRWGMANRSRAVDAARRTWHQRRVEIGADLRTSRITAGASQGAVGAAIGVSATEVSRRELGNAPSLSVLSLSEHAAAVGLKVVVSTFPIGGAVRDGAQLRYIQRFLNRISKAFHRQLEAPIPLPGDLRAVDILLRALGCAIAVEVITRFADAQAQTRAAQLKARDIGATRLIIVIADTRANRRALDAARVALSGGGWDLDSRRVMRALGAGLPPERDAIIVI